MHRSQGARSISRSASYLATDIGGAVGRHVTGISFSPSLGPATHLPRLRGRHCYRMHTNGAFMHACTLKGMLEAVQTNQRTTTYSEGQTLPLQIPMGEPVITQKAMSRYAQDRNGRTCLQPMAVLQHLMTAPLGLDMAHLLVLSSPSSCCLDMSMVFGPSSKFVKGNSLTDEFPLLELLLSRDRAPPTAVAFLSCTKCPDARVRSHDMHCSTALAHWTKRQVLVQI